MSKEIVVTNMVNDPGIRPENTRDLFKKIDERVASLGRIDSAINSARASMNELLDNKSKALGSLDTLTELVTEKLTDEDISKYGKELITKTQESESA